MARRRKKNPPRLPVQRGPVAKRDEGLTHGPSSRVALHYSESSSTAIPPPSMLAAYNNAVPDAAERILAMAEGQQAHRHKLEEVVIAGDSRRADYGLSIGGAIIAIAIICGTVLVLFDKDAQGLLIGVGSLVAALAAFVWGWLSRKKEVEQIRRTDG